MQSSWMAQTVVLTSCKSIFKSSISCFFFLAGVWTEELISILLIVTKAGINCCKPPLKTTEEDQKKGRDCEPC